LPTVAVSWLLVAKGLVSRSESSEDRRIRIVALTPLIAPIFRAHAATMENIFADLSSDEIATTRRASEACRAAS
jgi:DNA-binding MarR family transcriptional regulator